MTRRSAVIQRRTSAHDALCTDTEIAAAGMLFGFFRTDEWHTRGFWQAIARVHGPKIDAKVRDACPGCRPGYRYAIGHFPPVPLVQPVPGDHAGARDHLIVDGVKHWYVGAPYQKCQAQHLRELGEVDGAEWQRFLAWRRAGFPPRYVPDDGAVGHPLTLEHCCRR